MIARIKFEGTVKDGKKKSTLPDYVDIHVPPEGLNTAKEIFLNWVEIGAGIKGESGVFHPLRGNGKIKIESVTEIDGGEEASTPSPKKTTTVKAKPGKTSVRPAFPISEE